MTERTINPGNLQVDPTGEYAYYQLKDGSGDLLVEIIATNPGVTPPSGSGFVAGKEYWRVHGAAFQSDNYPTLQITKQAFTWSSTTPFRVTDANFQTVVEATWTTTSNAANRLTDAHGFRSDVSWNSSTSQWEGRLEWVRGNTDYAFLNVRDSPPTTLSGVGAGQPANSTYATFTQSTGLTTLQPPA